MNRYEKYKESGVPWLGEVPEHWEVWKITHSIDLIGSGTTPKSDNEEYYDGESLWVTTSELRENLIFDTKQKISSSALKDYSALKIYPKNSVAIAMYGATIGRLGILAKEATFNQACCVFGESKILHYKFLFYWLWYRRPILISLSNGGGQPNLSQDDLKKLKLPLPPYEEQTAIVNYLDARVGEIDALIEKQQTLLTKLAEQRTATITQAVTKGLNPNAPMKKSGVEWLGDVPEHWEVKRLKFLGDIVLGLTYAPENITNEENGTLVLRSSNIQNGKLTFDDNVFVNSHIPQKMITTKNDILICSRNGSRSLIGKCALIENEGLGQAFGAFMTVYRTNYRKFVYYTLNSEIFKSQLGLFLTSTINQLTTQVLGNFNIAFPPQEEQTSIANYLDKETAKIDRLCETIEQTIARLQEYRTALITQAVTGKIKVI